MIILFDKINNSGGMNISKLLKKYTTFLKYIVVSILSFLIDITFFTLFNFLTKKIILSTILARIISSFINYLLNKNKVFNENRSLNTIFKYYLLVIIQMLVSAFLVKYLYNVININPTIIKIPVEFTLFMCNYFIQKLLIFKRGNNESI